MNKKETGAFDVFPWNVNFETGISKIDEQHKTLVRLLNQLASFLATDNEIELKRVFEELADYADLHFNDEEHIWQPYFLDDEWYISHVHTHGSFLPRVLEIQKKHEKESLGHVVEEILKFLIHWLAFHILDTDKRMSIVLHSVDQGMSLGQAKEHANEEMSGSVQMLIDTVLSMYDTLSSRTLDLMRERGERIKAEAALQQAHDNLEKQVDERTRELRQEINERKRTEEDLIQAKLQAEAASKVKSEFLANMSHELRTPLNAIIGFSSMMEIEAHGPLGSDKYGEYLHDIQTSGSHLLKIIENILNMSNLESGSHRLHLESIEVFAMMSDCLSMTTEKATRKNIKLVNDTPRGAPPLFADQNAIKQCLLNLLSNAIKFTPDTGTVIINAVIAPRWYKITVSDTGIGIAKDDLHKLEQPFTQVERSKTALIHEGTGIGLAITRNLIEMHGGSLDIESEVGVGTTVTLCIPRGDKAALPEN